MSDEGRGLIVPGPGNSRFKPPSHKRKLTRRDVQRINQDLGRQLEAQMEANQQLNAQLVGYSKMFVFLLGGEVKVPTNGHAEDTKDLRLVAIEEGDEGGEEGTVIYRLVHKDELKEDEDA